MRISDWSSDVCSSDLAHARHEARRPHIGVLVEALADGQPQLPEGDVIGNVRIAHRAEVDGIEAAQDIDAVLRHHAAGPAIAIRSEEHTSELQSLMRISYAVFCLKQKNTTQITNYTYNY